MNHARCVEEEVLPETLDSIADEIHVQYPWGSLRRMMLQPVPDGLARLARVGRPGAGFRFTVNLLSDDHALDGTELADSYARAGLVIDTMRLLVVSPQTSWGKRLGGGREAAVLAIAGWITADADSGRKLAPGVSPTALICRVRARLDRS